MPRKLRELRAALKRAGCSVDRQAGSHQIWEHTLVPDFNVNLAGQDGADAKDYQEKQTREMLRRVARAKWGKMP